MTWWMYLLLVLVGGIALDAHKRSERRRHSRPEFQPQQQPAPVAARKPQADGAHDGLQGWPEAVASWVIFARRARMAHDIDNARMGYQKAAYGFRALTPAQNESLKAEVAGFVREDPRYVAGLGAVMATLRDRPGILQSELGKAAGDNREALNYVLYYAAFTGAIERVKSGQSYALYLPGDAPTEATLKPIAKPITKPPRRAKALTSTGAWERKRTGYFCEACGVGTSRDLGSPVPKCPKCSRRMKCNDKPCAHEPHLLVAINDHKTLATADATECFCRGCNRYLERT